MNNFNNKDKDNNYYKGLKSNEEEDIFIIFMRIVDLYDGDYQKIENYFKPGSETYTKFLISLEDYNWFEYNKTNLIIEELSIYLMDFK